MDNLQYDPRNVEHQRVQEAFSGGAAVSTQLAEEAAALQSAASMISADKRGKSKEATCRSRRGHCFGNCPKPK